MGRHLALGVLLLLAAVSARGQTRGAVDWIFLVDTSASMRGAGGTKDIFADVKSSIGTFVLEAASGDSVSLFTFDRDVQLRGRSDIRTSFDREDLLRLVDSVEANGKRTHLGAAIATGLERSETLQQRNDPTRARAIVLFTDGKEDVRGIANPVSIPSNIERALKSKPWIFFVSMGEHEAQLDAFNNARVLRRTDPEAIRQVAHEIREIIVPVPPKVKVTPMTLVFGEVDPGKPSEQRQLEISADKPVRVALSLGSADGVTMKPRTIDVTPSAPARIKVRLDVAEEAEPGPRQLQLKVHDQTIAASMAVKAPSPLIRIAKIAAVLALLAIAGGIWLVRYRRGNELEGEIEIVAPRVPSDAAFVGLPHLKTSEVAMSAIVPLDALAGADARLFVKRRDGEKKVWIAASSGSLRVNDVEVPQAELYDADTIQIGDAKLRFNRVGFTRPEEDFA